MNILTEEQVKSLGETITPNTLIHGDCLEVMKYIAKGGVDAVITDPPYGTTACKWDSVIDLKEMWKSFDTICNFPSLICLFGQEPYSTNLRYSNITQFKYDWIWEKSRPSGFVHSKNKPLKSHEIISVFTDGVIAHKGKSEKRMKYNPQGLIKGEFKRKQKVVSRSNSTTMGLRPSHKDEFTSEYTNYPRSILKFASVTGATHPTQKPVKLMEYLIKTYTNEGDTVLDFTMGSGTTGVACKNLNRNFIGIEKEKEYFDIACARINGEIQ